MLLGHPLFAGDNEMKHMLQIVKVLGTPTQDQIKAMSPNCGEYKLPNVQACGWEKVFKGKLDPEIQDYVDQILVYEPDNRLEPLKSLLHPFQDDLQKPNFIKSVEGLEQMPNLFDFTEFERERNGDTINLILDKVKSNINNKQ